MIKTARLLGSLLCLALFVGPGRMRSEEPAAQPTPHQRIYYFQHRLIPNWTHRSNGAFYEALRQGLPEKMAAAAAEIVDRPFADKLTVSSSTEPEGVLITYAEPGEPPLCHFAFIARDGRGHRCITLEKSEDLLGNGLQATVCEWTAKTEHRNYGPRKYTDAKAFLADVKNLLAEKETPAPAAVFSPGEGNKEK